ADQIQPTSMYSKGQTNTTNINVLKGPIKYNQHQCTQRADKYNQHQCTQRADQIQPTTETRK
ncbi:hypothetical protein CHS0354_041579, partial [Potamilus streckersoni]